MAAGRISYGSLENTVGSRLSNGAAAIAAGVAAGNINLSDGVNADTMELSERSRESQDRHAEMLRIVSVFLIILFAFTEYFLNV